MSQITTCPSCGTRFRVVADQLRISDGWVRCGQCQEVFNARNYLDATVNAGTAPLSNTASGAKSSPSDGLARSAVRKFEVRVSAQPSPEAAGATPSGGQLSLQQDAAYERPQESSFAPEAGAHASQGYELPSPELSSDIDFSSYESENSSSAAARKASSEPLGISEPEAPQLRTEGSDAARLETSPAAPPHRSADLQAAREAVVQAQDAASMRVVDDTTPRTDPLWDTHLPAAKKSEFPSLDLSILQVSVPPSVVSGNAEATDSGGEFGPVVHKLHTNEVCPSHLAHQNPDESLDATFRRTNPSEASDAGKASSADEGTVSAALKLAVSASPSSAEVPVSDKTESTSSASNPVLPAAVPADSAIHSRSVDDASLRAPTGHVSQIPAPPWPDLDPVWSASPEAAPAVKATGIASDALLSKAPAEHHSNDARSESEVVAQAAVSPSVDALESAAQRLAQQQAANGIAPPAVATGELPDEDEALTDELGFVRDARRKAWWQKPAVRVAMGAAVVVLPVALMLQVAVQERNALVAWQPSLRPAIEFMCTALQCELAPRKQISALVVSGSSFTQSGDRSYMLSLSVQNKARTALGMPALELTLTDTQDQAIARKVISAKELGAPTELASGREWTGTVPVTTNGLNLQVAGFRLMLFYP